MNIEQMKASLRQFNLPITGDKATLARRLCTRMAPETVLGPPQLGESYTGFLNVHERLQIVPVPQKGRGVRATRDIRRGTILGFFNGVHMVKRDVYNAQLNYPSLQNYAVSYTRKANDTREVITIAPYVDATGRVLETTPNNLSQMMFFINQPNPTTEIANVVFLDAVSWTQLPGMPAGHKFPVTVGVACVTCQDVYTGDELLVRYNANNLDDNINFGPACPVDAISVLHNKHFIEHRGPDGNQRTCGDVAAVAITDDSGPYIVHRRVSPGSSTIRGTLGAYGSQYWVEPVSTQTLLLTVVANPAPVIDTELFEPEIDVDIQRVNMKLRGYEGAFANSLRGRRSPPPLSEQSGSQQSGSQQNPIIL